MTGINIRILEVFSVNIKIIKIMFIVLFILLFNEIRISGVFVVSTDSVFNCFHTFLKYIESRVSK
jgi:hypothetical protein